VQGGACRTKSQHPERRPKPATAVGASECSAAAPQRPAAGYITPQDMRKSIATAPASRARDSQFAAARSSATSPSRGVKDPGSV
jgi:hypothetical protein